MVYKEDFIYNIYCGTHMTEGVTDNMVWIQGTMMPWFKTRLGSEKRKKHPYYICIIYRVKSECYINIGLHLKHILGDPHNRWCYG